MSVTPKPIDLNKCILCQKRKQSEYLSSGGVILFHWPNKPSVMMLEPLGFFN